MFLLENGSSGKLASFVFTAGLSLLESFRTITVVSDSRPRRRCAASASAAQQLAHNVVQNVQTIAVCTQSKQRYALR